MSELPSTPKTPQYPDPDAPPALDVPTSGDLANSLDPPRQQVAGDACGPPPEIALTPAGSITPMLVRSAGEAGSLIEQAAHDLRSSLNAIQSWSYVLERSVETLSAPAQRAMDGIRSGMQQQLALIEEMEEAVRLLVDESTADWTPVDLRAAMTQAIADRRAAAESRGVTLAPLDAAIDGAHPDQGFVVEADALRLAPLLRHLLIHCIWRAPVGGNVTAHLTAEPDYVKVRITESQPVDASRAATRLSALSEFFERRPPATGTPTARQSSALLLTRRMVELHGAALSAVGEKSPTDHVTVCIGVRFPRKAASPV